MKVMHSWRSTVVVSIGTVLISLVPILSCSNGTRWSEPSSEDLASFRDACLPIIEWAESQKKKDGAYPQQLSSELQQILDELPYPSEYHVAPDTSSFGISIGDYSVPSLFAYSYSSRDKRWTLDH